MEVKIWNWDYQTSIWSLAIAECFGILIGLSMAKSNKQYSVFHLAADAYLVFWGVFAMILFDRVLEFTTVLADVKYLSVDSLHEAQSRLNVLRYVIPAVSIAFGARFVGNWIVAEKPQL